MCIKCGEAYKMGILLYGKEHYNFVFIFISHTYAILPHMP